MLGSIPNVCKIQRSIILARKLKQKAVNIRLICSLFVFCWRFVKVFSYSILQDDNLCCPLCYPTLPQDSRYRFPPYPAAFTTWRCLQLCWTSCCIFLYSHGAGMGSVHLLHDQSVCPAVEHYSSAWSARVRKKLQVLNCIWKQRR